MGGPENGSFQKSLKIPLRNIKMAPKLDNWSILLKMSMSEKQTMCTLCIRLFARKLKKTEEM